MSLLIFRPTSSSLISLALISYKSKTYQRRNITFINSFNISLKKCIPLTIIILHIIIICKSFNAIYVMLFTPIKIMFICRANRLLSRTPAKTIIQHLKGISHFVLYYLDANTILVVTNLIFPSIFLFYSLYYIFLFPFNLCHSFNIVFPIISPNIQPIPL